MYVVTTHSYSGLLLLILIILVMFIALVIYIDGVSVRRHICKERIYLAVIDRDALRRSSTIYI